MLSNVIQTIALTSSLWEHNAITCLPMFYFAFYLFCVAELHSIISSNTEVFSLNERENVKMTFKSMLDISNLNSF